MSYAARLVASFFYTVVWQAGRYWALPFSGLGAIPIAAALIPKAREAMQEYTGIDPWVLAFSGGALVIFALAARLALYETRRVVPINIWIRHHPNVPARCQVTIKNTSFVNCEELLVRFKGIASCEEESLKTEVTINLALLTQYRFDRLRVNPSEPTQPGRIKLASGEDKQIEVFQIEPNTGVIKIAHDNGIETIGPPQRFILVYEISGVGLPTLFGVWINHNRAGGAIDYMLLRSEGEIMAVRDWMI